jgi:hypothetical protein
MRRPDYSSEKTRLAVKNTVRAEDLTVVQKKT